MSIAIFILNCAEFQPIRSAALAAGMTATPCGDYTRYLTEQDDLHLRRDQATTRAALWFACLTGGCDGNIVTFDENLVHLQAERIGVGA